MIPCVNAVKCRGPVWRPLPAGPAWGAGGWRGGLSMCVYIYVLPHPNTAPSFRCLCRSGRVLGSRKAPREEGLWVLLWSQTIPWVLPGGAPRRLAAATLLGLRTSDCGQLDLGRLAASLGGLVGHVCSSSLMHSRPRIRDGNLSERSAFEAWAEGEIRGRLVCPSATAPVSPQILRTRRTGQDRS